MLPPPKDKSLTKAEIKVMLLEMEKRIVAENRKSYDKILGKINGLPQQVKTVEREVHEIKQLIAKNDYEHDQEIKDLEDKMDAASNRSLAMTRKWGGIGATGATIAGAVAGFFSRGS